MGRVLAFVGDAPWIFALSVMAGASRLAWSKIPPGTPMPTGWTLQGRPAGRWPRATVLIFGPAFGFLIGLPLLLLLLLPLLINNTYILHVIISIGL